MLSESIVELMIKRLLRNQSKCWTNDIRDVSDGIYNIIPSNSSAKLEDDEEELRFSSE